MRRWGEEEKQPLPSTLQAAQHCAQTSRTSAQVHHHTQTHSPTVSHITLSACSSTQCKLTHLRLPHPHWPSVTPFHPSTTASGTPSPPHHPPSPQLLPRCPPTSFPPHRIRSDRTAPLGRCSQVDVVLTRCLFSVPPHPHHAADALTTRTACCGTRSSLSAISSPPSPRCLPPLFSPPSAMRSGPHPS